jgi:carboxyl-terminal processing protease
VSEASLHGHLKNEGEDTNGKEEELGSSSYVNPDKSKDTQLVYALDLLRGVDSLASDAVKKRAEAN